MEGLNNENIFNSFKLIFVMQISIAGYLVYI